MGRAATLLSAVAFVAVVVTAAGACGSRQPGVASTASGTPPPSTTAPETPATATPEPTVPALTYTCGGHPFSPTLFNEPEVDLRSTPAGVALAEFIETGQGGEEILPTDGFRLAGMDESSATFVAPLPGDPPYADAQLEKDADGWRVSGWGQCRPEIVVEGANSATWVLAPDQTMKPGTRTFVADVTERECASGRSSEGRVREPLIVYEADRVIVIFTVDPLPGSAFNCQGNPSTRVQVELSEPLGDRQLLDGGEFPWRDATKREPWQR
jgi:hypothetical protein